MSSIRNHNYQIGTDTLPTGKVRATARGRKTNRQTFPEGTTHHDAALSLAQKIERDRVAEVRELTRNGDGTKRDYAIYTSAPGTRTAFPALFLPDALTLTRDHSGSDAGEAYRDHIVARPFRGAFREIARLAIYDDGRVYARRSMHVRSTVDYADWSAVTRAVHIVNGQEDTSDDYYTGIVFAPNPVEVSA